MTRIVVIGDALLDRDIVGTVDRVCPDAPVPVVDVNAEHCCAGGAGRTATMLAGDGLDVVVVTALCRDAAGAELRRLLTDRGAEVVDLGCTGTTPEKVRVRASGQSLVRVDHGTKTGRIGTDVRGARAAIATADAIVVSDYGHGVASSEPLRLAMAARRGRTPVVWDPHPRGARPVEGVTLMTPNEREAAQLTNGRTAGGLAAAATNGRSLARRWGIGGVAVTMGPAGALLCGADGAPLVVSPAHASTGDPCGAGDRFAATATVSLSSGAVASEAVEDAVAAATRFVDEGSRPPATVPLRTEHGRDAHRLVADVRARGGRVVATGGCFDLLHAGHVATLTAARRLGDCLVVLLNSDSSVRRLKGADRPLQRAADRAAILRAVGCVDAVTIFDELTPERILGELRPDVFVKGGDYTGTHLPEQELLDRWGGQVVVVPYLAGRSTTRIVEEAHRHVRH